MITTKTPSLPSLLVLALLTVFLISCSSDKAIGRDTTPIEVKTAVELLDDCLQSLSPSCGAKLFPEILAGMKVQPSNWKKVYDITTATNPQITEDDLHKKYKPNITPTGPVFGTASRFETFVDTLQAFKDKYKIDMIFPTLAIIAPSARVYGGTPIKDNSIIKNWVSTSRLTVQVSHRDRSQNGADNENKLGLLSHWSSNSDTEIMWFKLTGLNQVGVTFPRQSAGTYGEDVTKTSTEAAVQVEVLPGFVRISMFPYGFTTIARDLPFGNNGEKINLMFVSGFETPNYTSLSSLSNKLHRYYGSSINRQTGDKYTLKVQRFHSGQFDASGYFSKKSNQNSDLQSKLVIDFSDSAYGPKIIKIAFLYNFYTVNDYTHLVLGTHYNQVNSRKDGQNIDGFPFIISGIENSEFYFSDIRKKSKIKSLYIHGKFYGPNFDGLGAVFTFSHTNGTVDQNDPNIQYKDVYEWGVMGMYRDVVNKYDN